MSDNTFWLLLWLGLASVIGCVISAGIITDGYRDCVALRNGYSHRAVPGLTSPVWEKDDLK